MYDATSYVRKIGFEVFFPLYYMNITMRINAIEMLLALYNNIVHRQP